MNKHTVDDEEDLPGALNIIKIPSEESKKNLFQFEEFLFIYNKVFKNELIFGINNKSNVLKIIFYN